MKKRISIFLGISAFIMVFNLFACNRLHIDEHYVSMLLRDKLSISHPVTVEKLQGGLSKAQLFVGTSASQRYVVRCINYKNFTEKQKEMHNLTIASQEGYGPHIYWSDESLGVIIMEYISSAPLTLAILQADQTYHDFADLLKKIHQGPSFKNGNYDIFKRIKQQIKTSEARGCGQYLPLAKLKKSMVHIQQVLSPHLTKAPCHNDLHLGNILIGKTLKAIDYEDAGENDPYFDIATIASTTGFCNKPCQEEILLQSYLGRKPTLQEASKLYLMKQIILIKNACDRLEEISPEYAILYESLSVPSTDTLMKNFLDGNIDLKQPKNALMLYKFLCENAFKNIASQAFTESVKALTNS